MTILLPTAYLPPISYIAACVEANDILIECHETYTKQTFRNHSMIFGPNGKQMLTVPVTKPMGNRTQTKDIRIAYELSWQKNHWRSFEAAYNKSPFFLYYQDYLIQFYEDHHTFLLDFNYKILDTLFMAIRLDRNIGFTASFEKEPKGIDDKRMELVTKPQWFHPEYVQVFSSKHGFLSNLSIIDLLFNLGPETLSYISPQ